MRHAGREERVIRSIHSNLLYVVVAAIIIAVIVSFNFSRQGLLGPIRGGPFPNMFLQWKISDHTTDNNPLPLDNQLNGTDAPEYAREGVVVQLQRQSNGDLLALPRYQGTLEYRAP